jgi:hypothetical protein
MAEREAGEKEEREVMLGLHMNQTVVVGCTNLKHWKVVEKKLPGDI